MPSIKELALTAARLRKVLHYNPKTGEFRRKIPAPKHPAGSLAGCVVADGYVHIRVDGRV